MSKPNVFAWCLVPALLLGACTSSSDGTRPLGSSQSEAKTIPACSWPSGAETVDATGLGCEAKSMIQVCNVPSGSKVTADGTIVTPDGMPAPECNDPCAPTEYVLSCHGAADAGSSAPSPDGALGCQPARLPTPSNTTVFCCPCSP